MGQQNPADLMNLMYNGVPVIVLVVAIVEALKRQFNLSGSQAILANALLMVVFYIVINLAEIFPELSIWVKHMFNVLVLFLSSAGFYSTGKFAVQSWKSRK